MSTLFFIYLQIKQIYFYGSLNCMLGRRQSVWKNRYMLTYFNWWLTVTIRTSLRNNNNLLGISSTAKQYCLRLENWVGRGIWLAENTANAWHRSVAAITALVYTLASPRDPITNQKTHQAYGKRSWKPNLLIQKRYRQLLQILLLYPFKMNKWRHLVLQMLKVLPETKYIQKDSVF